MDTIFFPLTCWLLALSSAVPQTEKGHLLNTPTITPSLKVTHTITDVTSPNSSDITASSKDTTALASTTSDNHTFATNMSTTAKSTGQPQTFQSTTVNTPITNSSSLTTATPGTHTSTLTAVTTPVTHTTKGYISTPDTTVITAANSSSTVNTTSQSMHTTTQGLGLNISERNLTILFSSILGVFAVALVVFTFHRCKQKLQYLHQPLNNTDDTDAFTADNDTLVISGGLYDGHPIYDNVPTPRTDESQFRLEFLH